MARHHALAPHQPLTPATLVRDFGARAAVTREAVRVLCGALESVPPAVLAGWQTCFGQWAGEARDRVPRHLAKVADRYGVSTTAAGSDALLFALQTYYALLVNLVVDRIVSGSGSDVLPDSPLSWCLGSQSDAVARLVERLTKALANRDVVESTSTADEGCDWFKPLYQDIFPRPLRHALGEYYTPDWLAAHVLDQVGYTGEPGQRLLDPACGSGTFLVMALRRLRRGIGGISVGAAPFSCPPIVGFDVNPLAVITARANYLIAIADLLPTSGRVEVPVYLCDSILGVPAPECAAISFDYVVGNPPWIAWDNLPDQQRQATKPLWERYGLFSLSGNAARHGGGKKDLSMLMLYAAADRYLKPDGRLGMVITQTLFQTKGAGDGFRRFRLGPDGPPLGVLRVDDMVALRPFDAANWTSTIVLQKGVATQYPVPYMRWNAVPSDGAAVERCLAYPVDPARPNSPWRISPDGLNREVVMSSGAADYTAHLGANSGGANGVYWVEVLAATPDGMRVRNIAARGKHPIAAGEHVIEPDLLYPLLRWGDIGRYSAVPRCHIVLTQDPAARAGLDDCIMRERYPRTLEYLRQFRELLTARAAYRRYQQSGPFYSMYNVGPYTIAPIKVVWRRMDRRINAAVVEERDDLLLGRRPVIPQETCVLVACETSDEAHYVCAVLNSAIVGELVSAHSVRGGKGFGTPGMLEFVPLGRFDPSNPRHLELASLSRQAHAAQLCCPADGDEIATIERLQRQVDCAAAELLCPLGNNPATT